MKRSENLASGQIQLTTASGDVTVTYREHDSRNASLLVEIDGHHLSPDELLQLVIGLQKKEQELARGRHRYAAMALAAFSLDPELLEGTPEPGDRKLKGEFRQARFRCDASPLPSTFFIITAHNPDGITVSDAANQQADEGLRAEISRLGYEPFPVTGGSADFTHAEPGHGLPCARGEALAMARQFRQLAIFEVRDGRVFLISALEDPEPDEVVGQWAELLSD